MRARKRDQAIDQAFRAEKRERRSDVKEEMVKAEISDGYRTPSPEREAQFPSSFVDAFRFTGLSSAPLLRSSAKKEVVKGDAKPDSEIVETLTEVPDYVKDDLDSEYDAGLTWHTALTTAHLPVLIIGSNPGRMSSQKSQHFAHPSNHFYRTLHGSGLTPTLVPPSLDYTMLEQSSPYPSIGLTNLAARPTRMAHELDKEENAQGTKVLLELIRRHRPRVGVFIGLGVARAFEQSVRDVQDAELRVASKRRRLHIKMEVGGKEDDIERDHAQHHATARLSIPGAVPETRDKDMGLGVGILPIAVRHSDPDPKGQGESDGRLPYTLLFASPSTSGRVTSHQLPQKTECMRRVRILSEFLCADLDERLGDDRKTIDVRMV